jgi:predicted dehydrogenase
MIDGRLEINRPLRWGMIGGGCGSLIGYIHRSAALRDRNFNLISGVFSTDKEKGKDFGMRIGLSPDRCYPDYQTLFTEEGKRSDGIEVVTIATPNCTHYEISKAALESGLHIICEKPLCFTDQEADELVRSSSERKLIFGITYGYSGYQMIQEARNIIKQKEIGKIRIINMQFSHGSYNTDIEHHNPSARWRVDPVYAGQSFVLGDIGTHVLFLAETIIPDLKIEKLLCVKKNFVEGRMLEDNAYVLLQYSNEIAGMLWVSAVNSGSLHGQKIRIVGEKASIEWQAEHPNQLKYDEEGKPQKIFERGLPYLHQEALNEDRITAGCPEGLFESWSNLYRRFAIAIDAAIRHDIRFLKDYWYPDVKAGARGVKFVNACVESANRGSVWINYN